MAQPRSLQAELQFQHGRHLVSLIRTHSQLEVELEAPMTGEQWRGCFNAKAIEELTQKTGNFKQFGIFCSMLESALLQSSDSVSLELLTFRDLELLRSRRSGMSAPFPTAGSMLSTRRYLILVYSVEFDRLQHQSRSQDELRRRHRELLAQLEELKASEQRLKLRVRTLTAELAASRRGTRTPSAPGSRERRPPSRSPSPAAPPRFDPTAFVRARQQQLQPHKQRRGAGISTSPARSRGRSSSADSCRSRRSELSSGNGAEPPPQRHRRATHGRRPLSTLTCNGARAGQRVTSCKVPTSKGPSKENHPESDLAEIDARLQALQEVMARMLPPSSQWEPPETHM